MKTRKVLAALAAAGAVTASALVTVGPVSAAGGAPSRSSRDVCGPVPAGYERCNAKIVTDSKGHAIASAVKPDSAVYFPADLQSAYRLKPTLGAGQTVAIVDAFDNPNAEADLAVYRAQFGLPACTTANGCFKKVNQSGGTSLPAAAPTNSWGVESSLDVDMVSAGCPLCHILLVEANDNGGLNLYAAAAYAATQAHYVSNSWGGGEFDGEGDYAATYFSHPGTIFTASTGDSGYGVQTPAAYPNVVAVGGTSLYTAANGRGWTETAWSGAGSGCSVYIPKPSWQNSAVTGCANRALADVSAVADPNTGVAIYDTYGYGGWLEVGGTSAAAPLVASVYALKGQGFVQQDASGLWNFAPKGFFDVKSGSNGSCSPSQLCTAVKGWDGPTGLGTPNNIGSFGYFGPTADLKIQETKTTLAGSAQLTLHYTISNLGPSTASSIVLVNDLVVPSFLSANATSDRSASCVFATPPAGKNVEIRCTLSSSLASGAVWHLDIAYNGGSKASFDSTTTVSGSPVDVNPANNTVHIATSFPK
jgi:hypothetical protein